MASVWAELERLLDEEPWPPELGPPAKEADIARCERRIGLRFPPELRDSYLRHNGGELPDGVGLVDLDEVETIWRVHTDPDNPIDDLTDDGRVRLHRAARIPFARLPQDCLDDGDFGHLWVDLKPGPRGRFGQVIAEGDGFCYVLADGFGDFLDYLRALVESGRTVADPEYGFGVKDRGGLRDQLEAAASRRRAAVPKGRLGLLRSVLTDDLDGVYGWIAAGRSLDERDRAGRTALLHAVLALGGADEDGNSPMRTPGICVRCGSFHAAASVERNYCRVLIEAGADVNLGSAEWSPLIAAVWHDDVATTRALLRAGADVDARNSSGMTALHSAVVVQATRSDDELDLSIVEMLVAAGADVNTADTRWHFTPLARAADHGQAVLVRFLLDHGAHPDATTAEHCALVDAAGRGHAGVVATLLAAGADVDATGHLGQTALMRAAAAGHVRVVEMLLAAGADIDAVDGNGKTALMEAAGGHDYERSISMFEEMFAESDVGLQPAESFAGRIVRAAQMQAAGGYAGPGHLQIVRLLLAGGADTGIRNGDGTALDHARMLGNGEIADLLESYRPPGA